MGNRQIKRQPCLTSLMRSFRYPDKCFWCRRHLFNVYKPCINVIWSKLYNWRQCPNNLCFMLDDVGYWSHSAVWWANCIPTWVCISNFFHSLLSHLNVTWYTRYIWNVNAHVILLASHFQLLYSYVPLFQSYHVSFISNYVHNF